MNDEARMQSVINMMVNSSVLMMTSMTTGFAGAVANGFSEAIAGAQDDEDAQKKVDEMRAEASQKITAMSQELIGLHADMSGQLTKKIEALTSEERAELIEDINDESYTAILDLIRNTDFGLPKITEKLKCEELAKYLSKQEDPRFGEIMESVLSANPPRAFMRSAEENSMIEETPEAPPAPPAPAVIEELPARFEFPPHFSSTITFPSDEEIILMWNSTFKGEAEQFGIKVASTIDGSTLYRVNPSGADKFKPVDGIITITMTNREDFPITVDISVN